jgi:hypothetical protein
MYVRSPFPPINVQITPIWRDKPKVIASLVIPLCRHTASKKVSAPDARLENNLSFMRKWNNGFSKARRANVGVW